MARPARGTEVLATARDMVARAATIGQLRQAQAVGRSPQWTCRLRNRFLAGKVVGDGQRQRRGGRRRQNMTPARERELLAPFLDRARTGGIVVVGQVRAQLEAASGRPLARSSVYNLLHRHGWRMLAPDRRHPQSDEAGQREWEEHSQSTSPRSAPRGRKGRSG